MAYFALTTVHGPNWNSSRGIREQEAWDEHAAFMDGLVEEGFVLLGGPIGDGEEVQLVVEAAGESAIRERMSEDPWASMGLLRVGDVREWKLWLDGRSQA
jgi:uncharacterized protein YciI